MKIKLKTILSLGLAILCLVAFVACAEDNDGNAGGGGQRTYVMEAEYINLEDKVGAGISNEAWGVNMIAGEGTEADKAKGWSNGYFIWCTYSPNLQFDFVFTSDKAEKAQIILRLGSEIGNITLTPQNFAVKLNGVAINYNSMVIEGSDIATLKFVDKTVATTAQLVEGENTISLVILENDLLNGQTGGPMIDCVKIKTKATLTWTDITDNPGNRGAI